MIKEKTIEKTRFFTKNGTDIWKVTGVSTITEVTLVNCETNEAVGCRIGEPSAEKFHAVIMPHITAAPAKAGKGKGKIHKPKKRAKKNDKPAESPPWRTAGGNELSINSNRRQRNTGWQKAVIKICGSS